MKHVFSFLAVDSRSHQPESYFSDLSLFVGKMELDEAAAAGDDAMSTRSAAGSQSSELSVDRLAG